MSNAGSEDLPREASSPRRSPPRSPPRSPLSVSDSSAAAANLRRRIQDLEAREAQLSTTLLVAEGGRDVAIRGQSDLARNMARMGRDLRSLERQIGESQAGRDRLQGEITALRSLPDTAQAHTAQTSTLLGELQQQQAEISDLRLVADQACKDRDALTSERDDLASRIAIAEGEVDLLKAEVDSAEREMEDLRYTMQRTEGSLEPMHRSLDLAEAPPVPADPHPTTAKVDQVTADLRSPHGLLVQAQGERDPAKSERDSARTYLDRAAQTLVQSHAERDTLLRERDSARADLERLSQDLTRVKAQGRDLRTYSSSRSRICMTGITRVVLVGSELDVSRRTATELGSQASNLDQRNADLVGHLATAVRARDSLQTERDDALSRLAPIATAMQSPQPRSSSPHHPDPATAIPIFAPQGSPDRRAAGGVAADLTSDPAQATKKPRDSPSAEESDLAHPAKHQRSAASKEHSTPSQQDLANTANAEVAGSQLRPVEIRGEENQDEDHTEIRGGQGEIDDDSGDDPDLPAGGAGDRDPPEGSNTRVSNAEDDIMGSPVHGKARRVHIGLSSSDESEEESYRGSQRSASDDGRDSASGSDEEDPETPDDPESDDANEDSDEAKINDDTLEQDTFRALSLSRSVERRR
ncbi:hypothetical protein V7S43_004765 [Phytophthora oleae]|uniref:Uncharacterized protein n=1 Tax=Phytophthora oleae TaxID=2107226 RepID=A0ABD3FVH3_9STRA